MQLSERRETTHSTVLSGRLAWFIVAMTIASTVLDVLDRNVLFVLAPVLMKEFAMTNAGYSHIVAAYYVSFTAMYTGSGWIMDRIG